MAEYFQYVQQFLTLGYLIQSLVIAASVICAYGLNFFVRNRLLKNKLFQKRYIIKSFETISPVFRPILTLLLLTLGHVLLRPFIGESDYALTLAYDLVILWAVLRLARLSTDNPVILWMTGLAGLAVIALSLSGQWDPFVAYLGGFEFKLGKYTFSVITVMKGILALVILFWAASMGGRLVRSVMGQFKTMQTSNRELVTKALQLFLYFVLFMVALDVMGIDLTALAVFGGALGVGLGFGLQKITSNLISGFILLMEKTVEVGDMIELENGVYGHVREISARYTMIETLDSKEIMVPNEEFITQRVINWTYSDPTGRLEFMVGVSYGTDLDKARELIIEAMANHPRLLKSPEPRAWLHDFGDSSVNFRVMYWVDDVSKKRWETKSDLLFAIWRGFKENGIEIPFPQRDLHVRSIDDSVLEKLTRFNK